MGGSAGAHQHPEQYRSVVGAGDREKGGDSGCPGVSSCSPCHRLRPCEVGAEVTLPGAVCRVAPPCGVECCSPVPPTSALRSRCKNADMETAPPYRKRMTRIEVPLGVRFLTFSCHHRLPLMRNPAICAVVLDSLRFSRTRYDLRVFAWVIMPEHMHLVVMPTKGTVAPALTAFKVSVAKRVIDRWTALDAPILVKIRTADGRPRFWQKGGGHDRNVRDAAELRRKIQYIHRNSVERGLVEHPEEWRWSSVRWWMGLRDGEFSCDPPPGDARSWMKWTGYV